MNNLATERSYQSISFNFIAKDREFYWYKEKLLP
jgi:hypothetical protein